VAEPTLNMKMTYLAGCIGSQLGYGRGEDSGERTWTTHQAGKVRQFLDSGLRWFYWPEPLPGEKEAHSWSFMHPSVTITLGEGLSSYRLPGDFGGLEGRITLARDDNSYFPLEVRSEAFVREMLARLPEQTGTPLVAAIAPLRQQVPTGSPRCELLWHPLADADYTATLPYYFIPDALTSKNEWAYGGAEHAETLLAACFAAGEQIGDGVQNGPLYNLFVRRLAASISLDRRKMPQNYGYNADRSDHLYGDGRGRPLRTAMVSFDGSFYE
jgi:hypothetical protein